MIHKTTRSILSVLLAALLLVTSIPLTPAFADGGAVSLQSESGEGGELTGSGAPTDPYQIATAADLLEFADKVNNKNQTSAWAELTANIDLNNQRWTPIGSDSSRYSGTFNGAGHTISGLYIDSSSADDQGLFGYLSTDGGNTGTVQNLSVSGSVSGHLYVGGIAGRNGGNVINCTFSGSVSGVNTVGGVVGDNRGTVENCYNTGSVTSSGSPVGGVVGYNDSGGSVTNCYNTGTVTGTDDYVGGVGGVVGWNISSGNVTNCYNTGAVSGGKYVGGVVGYNRGTVTGCYFLKQNGMNESLQGIGDGSGTTGATAVTTLDALCKNFKSDPWTISPFYNHPVLKTNPEGGDGTAAHPYEIKTAAQLKTFRDIVNGANRQVKDSDAHAKLMNDIDLNPDMKISEDGAVTGAHDQWTPIGTSEENAYTGTFNGNGHTISGLYINDRTAYYQGLFGYLRQGGTVQNLTVSGSVSVSGPGSGSICVGGVVGMNNGTVTNCYNTGNVSVTSSDISNVGGVVGYNGSSSTVENCYNTGKVSGPNSVISNVGGVVGDNGGTVINCYNTGKVSGPNSVISNVGGVVGDNGGTVENCYNTGNVSVKSSDISNVGGVVGDNSSTVTNCYNTGNVSVTSSDISSVSGDWYVGGVVGLNSSSTVTGTVTDCYFLKQNGVPAQGIGSGSGSATAKDNTAFQSGEVAYLLQSKQTDESGLVWGQTLGGEEDSLPTLVALNPDAAKEVYQLTFDWRYEGAPEGTTTTTNVYTNGSVAIPEINHDRAGYHISGWKDASGAPVTTETAVTADTIYTAEWIANTYTITVTAGSGGAVNGGGTFAEGTQVTVTATANDGYTFVAWQEGGTKIENAGASYTFTVNDNCTLTAIFEKEPDPTPTPTPTPDPTPSGPSTGDSTGWDDIRDELENAAKGDEITIDMGDETKVPAEIFESLAGKDVEISFDLGDIQWSVNGADIPTDTDFTDLDLGVNLDTSGIPVNVINTITGEVGTVQITLAHDGEFGFTMTLTAPLGKENAGYWANLYHYDESAEAMNFEAAAKIDEDGSVTIPFSHASQYAIVIDTHSHAAVDVSDLFIDVTPDAWYKDAVQYAYDQGLMTGVSATEFAPEATTTRAMIVSILARLEGVTTAEAAGFADVDDNDWYATAVNWAANVGVVNGYEDNTFQPNTAITREQLAAILMNYAAYKGEDVSNRASLTSYTDQPSTWATETMSWAVAEGLINGVTNDQLQPQGNATRAQVAAILQRYLEA